MIGERRIELHRPPLQKAEHQHAHFSIVPQKEVDTVDVLGVPVHILDRSYLTRLLGRLPNGKAQGWVSYVNINAINLAQELPWFRNFLQDSLVTYCDGEGVRLGSRILGEPLPERIVLTDWVYDVCAFAEKKGWKLFLLGSTDPILEKTLRNLQEQYPTLRFAGAHHGYFTNQENLNVVSLINQSRADLLLVAMGMPKQELWILENIGLLNVPLVMNAGSCFDYVAGVKHRCPRWMGRMGLEWFYRLLQEPRRLWKRYLVGNPLFLFRVILQKLGRKVS